MTAAQIATPAVRLHDGIEVPQLGLTLFQVPPEETRGVVEQALEAGYRHFDTAAAHGNEREVGEALIASRLPREEYFVTSKLSDLQPDPQSTLRALEASLERLGLDHVDLCLINGSGSDSAQLLDAWQALEWIHREEVARTIGVANFGPAELELLERQARIRPTINQVELHPRLQQPELCALHTARGITTEAWGPLGQPELLDDPVISRLAESHGKTPAQVVLRWQLQLDHVIVAKPVSSERLRESLGLFDFELCNRELAAIADLGRAQQMLLR
ncbi:MAG TPA: aldo/keto reductase [Solirubrobacterales bacterium]|nr:aldo/keto reductase [Solirubrobacterales bacterium]